MSETFNPIAVIEKVIDDFDAEYRFPNSSSAEAIWDALAPAWEQMALRANRHDEVLAENLALLDIGDRLREQVADQARTIEEATENGLLPGLRFAIDVFEKALQHPDFDNGDGEEGLTEVEALQLARNLLTAHLRDQAE